MAEGNPIKYSELIIDDGSIEKAVSDIDKLEKKFKKTQTSMRKEIEETRKVATGFTDATEDQEKELEKLEKQIEDLIKANKKLVDTEDDIVEQKKRALKLMKQDEKLKKKLIELEEEQALEIARTKVEISEKNKALREQIKREKGLTNAYDDQSKNLNRLRREYKALAVENKENTTEAQNLLKSITKLDERLKEIDKTVGQTQRTVGDYKEQMKEAIEETSLFAESMTGAIDTSGALSGILGKLQMIIGLLSKAQSKLNTEVKEGTVATKVNDAETKKATITQKLFRKSTLGSAKAMKVLKLALIGSGLGLIVALLGTVVATLSKTQAGLNGIDGAMRSFGAVLEVVVGRLIILGGSIADTFSVVIDTFSKVGLKMAGLQLQAKKFGLEIKNIFGDYDGELKKVNAQIEKNEENIASLSTAISKDWDDATQGFIDTFTGLGDAISDAIDKAVALSIALDKIKLKNAEISKEQLKQQAISEKAEEIEGDATRSFEERTRAILKSIDAQQQASKLGEEIAQNNLDAVNLELALIEKNRELLTDEKIRRIEAEKEVLEAKKDFEIKSLQLLKVRRQLNQDEIEKNLDILIDGFDNQKTVNEQLIADDSRRFNERRKMLTETIELQKKVLKEEVSEINKVAKGKIDINDLIQTSDAKLLQEKIRAYKLSEILEGRLLEVVREARTQETELSLSLLEIDKERLELKKEINQQLEDLSANNIEGEKKRSLELLKIEQERAIEEINIQQSKFDKEDEEYKILEAQKTEVNRRATKDREDVQLEALAREQERARKTLELKLIAEGKTQEEINEELLKQEEDFLKDERDLRLTYERDTIDQELALAKIKNDSRLKEEKKYLDDIQRLQDNVAEGSFRAWQKNIDRRVDELDKLEDKQLSIIETQEARAQEGLENTLAFEEGELAKLEKKKIEAQKKQIVLDKTRALYSAYSNASASGDKNAILTVLKDFAILNGVETALSSFGEGTGSHGTFGDALDSGKDGSKNGNSLRRGIFRGESHAKRGKGIKVLVEGKEGLLSGKQMNALGVENFRSLTNHLDSGGLGSDIFSGEASALQSMNVASINMSGLTHEMKETRKAIENNPQQMVDIQKVSETLIEFIDVRKKGNKTLKSRFQIKKSKF